MRLAWRPAAHVPVPQPGACGATGHGGGSVTRATRPTRKWKMSPIFLFVALLRHMEAENTTIFHYGVNCSVT